MLNYPINVTLDTNIIDETKYDFSEDGVLSILEKYVKQNKVKVYLSTIVVGETKKHCESAASKAYSLVRSSISDVQKIKCRDFAKRFSEIPEIPNKEEMIAEGATFIDDLNNRLQTNLITPDEISLGEIFEDYFHNDPPFEEEGKKKSEFPDAVISKQIRRYFSDKTVYVISKDKGFKKSLSDCNNVKILNSIGDLNKLIVQDEKDYQKNLEVIISNQSQISDIIKCHILDEDDIELIGGEYDRKGIFSGVEYEETSIDSIEELELEEIALTYFDDTTICADVSCKSRIQATGSFMDYDNSQWDSENKEYVYEDWHDVIEEHEVEFTCQISMQKSTKQVDVVDMNIVLSPATKIGELVVPSESDKEKEAWGYAEQMDALENNAMNN